MAIRSLLVQSRPLASFPPSLPLASHITTLPLSTNPKHPTRSLRIWEQENLSIPQLRGALKQLLNSARYSHALQVMKLMETLPNYRYFPSDHALRLELTYKTGGLSEAEEYFRLIPDSASQKSASLPLLSGYVKEREVERAEAFLKDLNERGLLVSTHPFNEIMKLYMSTFQFRKVPSLIARMKRDGIPRNVMSYNLWMRACGEINGAGGAERVYEEMVRDGSVDVGWSSLVTLANVYVSVGLREKALLALVNAERKLTLRKRLGYFFLITLYSSLGDKERVVRVWEASKAVGGRITSENYICVLSCLVKLGEIREAERVFLEWEAGCGNFDVRVSNVLLGAYVRDGLMRKAESLHLRVLDRGGCPNYKTWEILMEGWVKCGEMDKAFDAMKKGFAMLKDCDLRPSLDVLLPIAKNFEIQQNLDGAMEFLRIIHHVGLVSLALYKILLRMHLCAQRPPDEILKMIAKDDVELNAETSALIQALHERSASADGGG